VRKNGCACDRLGARRVLTAGLGLLMPASVGCGLAPSGPALVAAQLVQGSAAAVILPAPMALIRQAFTGPAARVRALAAWAMGGAAVSPAGPVAGGLLDALDWRWIFLVNLPAGAVTLALLARRRVPAAAGAAGLDRAAERGAGHGRAHLCRHRGRRPGHRLARGDHRRPGARDRPGRVRGCAGPRRASDGAAGAVPVPAVVLLLAVGFVYMAGYYGMPFVVSLYLQQARGLSALAADALFVPMMAAGAVLTPTEYLIAGLLPQMAAAFGTSLARTGLPITAFAIGMIIGAPSMALATARLPRRVTLVLALAVFAAGHVLAALSPVFAVVLAARVLTALVTGAFWSVAAALATDAADPQRATRTLGVMMSGVELATVVGVPLGALVGQHAGWRGAFWGLAVLAAASALIIGRFVAADHNPADASAARSSARCAAAAYCCCSPGRCSSPAGTWRPSATSPPLITSKAGLPDSVVPLALAGYGAGSLIGTNLVGRYADRASLATYLSAATTDGVVMALIVLADGAHAATIALIALIGVAGMAVPPGRHRHRHHPAADPGRHPARPGRQQPGRQYPPRGPVRRRALRPHLEDGCPLVRVAEGAWHSRAYVAPLARRVPVWRDRGAGPPAEIRPGSRRMPTSFAAGDTFVNGVSSASSAGLKVGHAELPASTHDSSGTSSGSPGALCCFLGSFAGGWMTGVQRGQGCQGAGPR
jgi:predicted MFS family arabinose efflux permease